MSDTPRTNAAQFGTGRVSVEFARQLERELNAANDRIQRLEEELMDTKNKHAVLVADVVLNEDRAERIKRLEDWKESALEIEREWDANAIATMLGGKLGESQRNVIQREVPKLLARIKRLEEALLTLVKMHRCFTGKDDGITHERSYYCFYKGQHEHWKKSIDALEAKEAKL